MCPFTSITMKITRFLWILLVCEQGLLQQTHLPSSYIYSLSKGECTISFFFYLRKQYELYTFGSIVLVRTLELDGTDC